MKTNVRIILPLLLLSAILILLVGCMVTPTTDDSPGATPGTIIGTIAAPCCSTSVEAVSNPPADWCCSSNPDISCREEFYLQDNIEVILTYGGELIDITMTNEKGEYTFTDVPVAKNYVITVVCPDNDRILVKDVAPEVLGGQTFDAEITDWVSTSLGMVVDFLLDNSILGPEDIELEEVIDDKCTFVHFPAFIRLVIEVRRVGEECGDLYADDAVMDALCKAAEQVGRIVIPDLDLGCVAGATPGPGPGPTPDPCDGNVEPVITDVTLGGESIFGPDPAQVVIPPLVVGDTYGFCVYADDDDILSQELTYSLTIDNIDDADPPFNVDIGTNSDGFICISEQLSFEQIGTYEVTVNVFDGCEPEPTTWGPVTIVVEPNCYELAVTIDGQGTVGQDPLPEGDPACYLSGTVVDLTPTADPGWIFAGWSGPDGGDVSGDAITMDEDKAVTATFTQDEYTLTVLISPAGAETAGCSVDRDVSGPYNYGDIVQLTSNAAPGWTFTGWSGDLNGSTDPDDVTMNSDKTVTATFTEDCYTLIVNIVGNGAVAKDVRIVETCYAYGTEIELTPTADPCWYFDRWEGDLTGNDDPASIIMDGDKTVTAVFLESPTADITLTARYDLAGEDCEDVWLWWHKPCNHTNGRDYMEVDVEIKNATSTIGSVIIEVKYDTGIGGLDECTSSPHDGDNDGTFILNSSNKTLVKFKKYGPDTGGTSCDPTEDGSDWKDSATVEIVQAGTSIFDSDGHKYCLNYDSIEIEGDDNQIRNK